jgi:hypothetical protein
MEHWQGPAVAITWHQVVVDEITHDIQISVAVGNHHPFRPRRRSACAVDCQEIAFGDLHSAEVKQMRG